MPKNKSLTEAKNAKNDEFFTLYEDIETEIMAYVNYNPDVFRDKVILLPCDKPDSNFTSFFIDNFHTFGLKKLIATSLKDEDGNATKLEYDGNTVTEEVAYDGGDFRSLEVSTLRDSADFIITNPPFSLFRDFLEWILYGDKKFIIVGSLNAITYKNVFPLIKDNKIWVGNGFRGGNARFTNPEGRLITFGNITWYTNVEHGKRYEPLELRTMEENISSNPRLKGRPYIKYDNYDAIEVPFTNAIPSDYKGMMGVPISFIDKYCPEQFEIMGITDSADDYNLKTKVYSAEECRVAFFNKYREEGFMSLNSRSVVIEDGIFRIIYARILIRHREGQ